MFKVITRISDTELEKELNKIAEDYKIDDYQIAPLSNNFITVVVKYSEKVQQSPKPLKE